MVTPDMNKSIAFNALDLEVVSHVRMNVLRALQARRRRMIEKPKEAIHQNAPFTKLPVQNLIN